MIPVMLPTVTIDSLHVYPLKSARGIDLVRSRLGTRGLLYDRHWMFIDARGRFISQRTHPILATLAIRLDDHELELSHPNTGTLRIPLPEPFTLDGPRQRVSIWRREHEALDTGDTAAEYASRLLGAPTRLVSALEANFPDGYPLLVCNLASLKDLSERQGASLPMNRFRPNIVLQGLAAWDEDRIAEIMIGEVRLRFVKPCTRCVITSLDQTNGESAEDPLPTLKAFRYNNALKGVTFGENATVQSGSGATIEVGAAVEIIWKKSSGR